MKISDKRGLFLCERQTFRVRSTVGDALIRSADERPGIRNECNLPKANPVRFRNGSVFPPLKLFQAMHMAGSLFERLFAPLTGRLIRL